MTRFGEDIVLGFGVDQRLDAMPHRFRNTRATDLLKRLLPLDEVQEMLGHASPETTERYVAYNRHTRSLANQQKNSLSDRILSLGSRVASLFG